MSNACGHDHAHAGMSPGQVVRALDEAESRCALGGGRRAVLLSTRTGQTQLVAEAFLQLFVDPLLGLLLSLGAQDAAQVEPNFRVGKRPGQGNGNRHLLELFQRFPPLAGRGVDHDDRGNVIEHFAADVDGTRPLHPKQRRGGTQIAAFSRKLW